MTTDASETHLKNLKVPREKLQSLARASDVSDLYTTCYIFSEDSQKCPYSLGFLCRIS